MIALAVYFLFLAFFFALLYGGTRLAMAPDNTISGGSHSPSCVAGSARRR